MLGCPNAWRSWKVNWRRRCGQPGHKRHERKALIAYRKGACHMTYRVIETFLSDVLHLPLSTGPGVEPTNNAMEQRFRFVVIDRKITRGTRGETGRRWCERIWTVLTTCAQQRRSAFEFLYDSIVAHFGNQASPSLLPLPP